MLLNGCSFLRRRVFFSAGEHPTRGVYAALFGRLHLGDAGGELVDGHRRGGQQHAGDADCAVLLAAAAIPTVPTASSQCAPNSPTRTGRGGRETNARRLPSLPAATPERALQRSAASTPSHAASPPLRRPAATDGVVSFRAHAVEKRHSVELGSETHSRGRYRNGIEPALRARGWASHISTPRQRYSRRIHGASAHDASLIRVT